LFFAKLNFLDVTATGIRIRYQVPNKSGSLQYGYFDSTGTFHAGWSAAIEFVPKRVLLEINASVVTTLPVEKYNFSLNLDADLVDAWFVGRIVKRVYDSNLLGILPISETVICEDDVMLTFPTLNGDVDGNGSPDPFLQFLDAEGVPQLPSPAMTAMIQVTVWLGRFDMDHRHFYMRKNTECFKLKNKQF
jgi:hypothetical protein